MPRNLRPRTQAINAAKAKIGEILNDYARAKDLGRTASTRSLVLETIQAVARTPEEATERYRRRCESFLDGVVAVRGIPFKAVGAEDDSPAVSGSGDWVAEHFDELVPEICCQLETCVKRFHSHALMSFQRHQDDFTLLLDGFLKDPPRLAKDIGPRVTPLKREAGYYAYWDRVIGVLTNISFINEVDFLFHYRSGQYTAVAWHYNRLDEQQDYPPATDHKTRDGSVYAIKDNWALKKGLMTLGRAGYIEDKDIPGRQLGCMCHLQWISSLSDLPEDMLTDHGREYVRQKRELFQDFLAHRKKQSWISRILARLQGKSGSNH